MPLRGKLTSADITANCIDTVVAVYAKKAGIEMDGLRFMDSERPQPPMPWSMRPISPRSMPGWDMPISVRPKSMIAERTGLRIRRPIR